MRRHYVRFVVASLPAPTLFSGQAEHALTLQPVARRPSAANGLPTEYSTILRRRLHRTHIGQLGEPCSCLLVARGRGARPVSVRLSADLEMLRSEQMFEPSVRTRLSSKSRLPTRPSACLTWCFDTDAHRFQDSLHYILSQALCVPHPSGLPVSTPAPAGSSSDTALRVRQAANRNSNYP